MSFLNGEQIKEKPVRLRFASDPGFKQLGNDDYFFK